MDSKNRLETRKATPMTRVITASQAAELIKDGDTVAAPTFGLAGWAEEIAFAVRDRFLTARHPMGITFLHAAVWATGKPGVEAYGRKRVWRAW